MVELLPARPARYPAVAAFGEPWPGVVPALPPLEQLANVAKLASSTTNPPFRIMPPQQVERRIIACALLVSRGQAQRTPRARRMGGSSPERWLEPGMRSDSGLGRRCEATRPGARSGAGGRRMLLQRLEKIELLLRHVRFPPQPEARRARLSTSNVGPSTNSTPSARDPSSKAGVKEDL
jgi:hypothetical protein